MSRDCYKQKVHWRKLGVWSIVSFHWLNCDCLSLAEFSTGRGKYFLLLLVLVESLSAGDANYVSSCWDLYWPWMVYSNECIDHDSSLFWPSDCILVRFPLLIFIFPPFDEDISPKASIVKSQDFLSCFLLCFVFYQHSVAFCPSVPGRTFPGLYVPHQKEKMQTGKLWWSRLSNKKGWKRDISGISQLKFVS